MSTMGQGDPLKGSDAAWLRLDRSENLLVISALAVIEGLSFEAFRERIESRFLKMPRFRLRPVARSGVYFWEQDSDFDFDHHVSRVSLPAPADKKTLQDWLGDQLSNPLDPRFPLWHFHFIENYPGGPAVVMRVHHCYADGLALIAVFASLTDKAPQARQLEALPDVPSMPKPRIRHRVMDGMEQLLERLEKAARLAGKGDLNSLRQLADREFLQHVWQSGMEGLAELVHIAALPKDPATVLKPKPGVIKRCAWSDALPLRDFKEIARAFGCSVNDVLVSVVSGGLRRHLMRGQSLPENLRLHGTLPVNLRSLDDMSSLSRLGNRFGTVFVPLSVGIRNPLERLFKTKHDMINLRESGLPMLSHWIMGLIGLLPGHLQSTVMGLFSDKSSLVLSNVPGAKETRYIAGCPIRELMFWVPQAGEICLGISLLSYQGQVQIGVTGDQAVTCDPDRLIRDMLDELQVYRDLAHSIPQAMPES